MQGLKLALFLRAFARKKLHQVVQASLGHLSTGYCTCTSQGFLNTLARSSLKTLGPNNCCGELMSFERQLRHRLVWPTRSSSYPSPLIMSIHFYWLPHFPIDQQNSNRETGTRGQSIQTRSNECIACPTANKLYGRSCSQKQQVGQELVASIQCKKIQVLRDDLLQHVV